MNRMHGAGLTEPIDPADALFEANGVPWELEVHNQAAARLQVQSFGSGIRSKQKVRLAAVERVDGPVSLGG